MPTVNITLTDTEEDGGVNMRVEFDPPVLETQESLTQAQAEGAFILDVMRLRAEGKTLTEIAEEVDEEDYGTVIPGTAEITDGEVTPESEKN